MTSTSFRSRPSTVRRERRVGNTAVSCPARDHALHKSGDDAIGLPRR